MGVTIKVDGGAQVLALIEDIIRAAGDMKPVWRDFGGRMVGSVRDNFLAGGRPAPWAPLKLAGVMSWALNRSSWRRAKTRRGTATNQRLTSYGQGAVRGRKPLIDTSRGMNSVHWKLIANGVAVGTNVGYLVFHQFGTKGPYPIRPRNKRALWWPGLPHPVAGVMHPGLPARPFLMVQAADWDYLVKKAGDHLLRTQAGMGGFRP